ncbi:hypothetical protein LINGRAHAP2_LOCUS14918 [Linum grandiflorum]
MTSRSAGSSTTVLGRLMAICW